MIWLMLYLLVFLVLGMALALALAESPTLPLHELAARVLAFGLGGAGLCWFWLSLIGLIPSRLGGAIIAIVAIALIAVLVGRGRKLTPAREKSSTSLREMVTVFVLLLPVLLGLTIISVHALGHVCYEWDGYLLWGMKTRAVTADPLMAADYFHNPHFQPLHQRYPLMVPFLAAGVNGFTGNIEDVLVKAIFPLIYVALLLMLYAGMRDKLPAWRAAILLSLFALMPVLLRSAGTGMADVPLSMFYFGAVLFIVRWTASNQPRHLVQAMFFATCCLFCKREGIAFMGLFAGGLCVVALASRDVKRLMWLPVFFAIVIAVAAPWFLFASTLPKVPIYLPAITITEIPWSRLPLILEQMWSYIGDWRSWNGLWFVLPILAVVTARRSGKAQILVLWSFVLAHFALYLYVYVIRPGNWDTIVDVTQPRLTLHIAPVAMLLLAHHWAAVMPSNEAMDGDTKNPENACPDTTRA